MTERVLILGGGGAGLTVAQGLRGKGFAITLVDQHNYHLFQPLLYQVATGELLGEAITTPLRHLLPSYGVSFRLGNVIEIDLLRCQVHMEDGGVCQGSCRVTHFLSGLFILSLRVQIYRPDGCPIACTA
ncbi:FAD-dependent oxidoreductase [Acidithiobacillus ferriphilus]|nr:FAD-dependent oxidoreductase [Acidithiobacillus ferriphilus]